MKKIFILLFFVGLHIVSKSQIAAVFSDEFPDSAKTRIGLAGNFGINSNAITAKFFETFYKGGYIDNDLKNSVLERVKNDNRIGADVNYGAYVGIKLDSICHKKDISLFFSIRDREHFDARFSNDFYKVGFYGNASYAGKLADFNNFNLNFLRYQQLQVGLFSSKYDSAARWGIAVSVLKGEQYASILAKKAELFTSPDGQYIDFNTSMQVAQSDTAHKGIGAFNGIGASIDIYFEAPFKSRLGNSKLRVSVSDIGAIKYNNKSLYLNQDSLFHYSGISVNSIYDLQNSSFAHTSQDTLIKSIAPFKKRSFSVTLPTIFNLTYETQLSKKFQLTEGIRYVFNGNYKMLYYLKGNYSVAKNVMVSGTFGYGGYGTFNYGLGVFANFGKGFILYAGSNNLEGFILPKKTSGMGGYVSIIKDFK
ncbi:MAG: hypothetical protein ACXVPY_11280 [Bacteroidia bacterium]